MATSNPITLVVRIFHASRILRLTSTTLIDISNGEEWQTGAERISKMLPRHTEVHKIEDGLHHKNNKWFWKRYEPHCPSRTCTGGHRNKLHRISGNPNWLGRQLWDKKKEEEILCRCSYCGLVWFQKDSEKLGFDARPLGYYDDFEHPWEFVPLRKRFKIREQNARSYWYNLRKKAIRPPRWGGVD